MIRGCVVSILILLGLFVAYASWFRSTFPAPECYVGAGIAAFIATCGIGALSNAWTARKDLGLLSTADAGLVHSHGRLVTVAGRIEAAGRPIKAPFSDQPCLICEYDIRRPDSQYNRADDDDRNPGSDYAGFLMAPCVIRTATEKVAMLGYPILEGFSEQLCASAEAVENAKAFITNHEFDDRSGLGFVTVLGIFDELWTDDDGAVEKNIRIRKVAFDELFPGPTAESRPGNSSDDDEEDDDETGDDDVDDADDPQQDQRSSPAQPHQKQKRRWTRYGAPMPHMSEKRVQPGTAVCAIGVYDEVRGGLGPNSARRTPTRLLYGSLDDIRNRRRTSMIRYTIGGIMSLIAVHAVILLVILIFRQSEEFKKFQEQQIQQQEQQ